uniref:ATP synthase complex subunit 8 n=1 Tax=Serratella sp. Yunnan-2018 TaxID=2748058 RepID=A0A7D6FGI3_9INSE|nr:ATP synthase F0 subunit 8 [Serratella sp. Yunnan-2018]QLP88985.1 ATP synthase F0 subunit 8 [Serratella sp. Yunnan-2018]
MPQMAPLSWLMLFFSFTVIFMLFSMFNYFITCPATPGTDVGAKTSCTPLTWKW